MSRIGNFMVWFEEEGYDYGDEKSVQQAFDDYMKTEQYMKTKQYQREHDEQERVRSNSLEDDSIDGVIDNLRNVGLRVFDGDDIKYMLDNGITPDMVGLGTPKDRNS